MGRQVFQGQEQAGWGRDRRWDSNSLPPYPTLSASSRLLFLFCLSFSFLPQQTLLPLPLWLSVSATHLLPFPHLPPPVLSALPSLCCFLLWVMEDHKTGQDLAWRRFLHFCFGGDWLDSSSASLCFIVPGMHVCFACMAFVAGTLPGNRQFDSGSGSLNHHKNTWLLTPYYVCHPPAPIPPICLCGHSPHPVLADPRFSEPRPTTRTHYRHLQVIHHGFGPDGTFCGALACWRHGCPTHSPMPCLPTLRHCPLLHWEGDCYLFFIPTDRHFCV